MGIGEGNKISKTQDERNNNREGKSCLKSANTRNQTLAIRNPSRAELSKVFEELMGKKSLPRQIYKMDYDSFRLSI